MFVSLILRLPGSLETVCSYLPYTVSYRRRYAMLSDEARSLAATSSSSGVSSTILSVARPILPNPLIATFAIITSTFMQTGSGRFASTSPEAQHLTEPCRQSVELHQIRSGFSCDHFDGNV